jgi:hypothetical protein
MAQYDREPHLTAVRFSASALVRNRSPFVRSRHQSRGLLAEPAIQNAAPTAPPRIGATQNSQSCASAHPPAKRAGPVLRAGLTEVFVTRIETRWIKVSAKPMAIGAKPAGALPCVDPMMTNKNMAVSTNSATKAETRPYWPGECSP